MDCGPRKTTVVRACPERAGFFAERSGNGVEKIANLAYIKYLGGIGMKKLSVYLCRLCYVA